MYIHVRKDLLIRLKQGYPFVVHEAWILPMDIHASLDVNLFRTRISVLE